MNTQSKLDTLANHGITTSVVYGPCGDKGILFSVDVLTSMLNSFESPFAASTYDQAVDIAFRECFIRGWLPQAKVY